MEKLIIPSILLAGDLMLLSERLLEITRSLIGSNDKISNLHINLSQLYERLVKNQEDAGKNLYADELDILDKRRCRALIGMRDTIQGMSIVLPNEMSPKASKLCEIINKYCAEAYLPGYKAETSMLISFIYEFDLPDNLALLADLHILTQYESLKGAQIAYDEVSQKRSEAINKRVNESESESQIQEEILLALTSLISTIQLYYQLDPAKYGDTYNRMISSITEVNSNARSRQVRRQYSEDNKVFNKVPPI